MRAVVLFLLTAAACAAPGFSAKPLDGGAEANTVWAHAAIEEVTALGLLAPDAESFRPDDDLTRGELSGALEQLGKQRARSSSTDRVVTIRELDAQLVRAAGLRPAARRILLAARGAGLAPHPALGTETVARLLRFRLDHPVSEEHLERGLSEPASRAEAAYSLSKLVALDPGRVTWIDDLTKRLLLPAYSTLERAVLSRAIRFVGSPYVFSGVSERSQQLWATDGTSQVSAPGGFDCSGFVWRVFKAEPFVGVTSLSDVLRGRSSYEMSGEIPSEQRIELGVVQPADLLFFGERGRSSKPEEVGHMGIYVGAGWFVHASSTGVTLQPLEDWYLERFAWGRSLLREAGLVV